MTRPHAQGLMAMVNRLIFLSFIALVIVVAVTIYSVRAPVRPPLSPGSRFEGGNGSMWRKSNSVSTKKYILTTLLSPTTESSLGNPGCSTRRLSSYKPVDTGTSYDHPAIVQYAKLTQSGAASLTFMDYMAMMSAYKFLRPDKIIVHTYTDITGKYWNLAQKWNTSIEANRIQRITRLGGKSVSYIAHQADFIKIRGLLEFGGVTSDFDVIVVNGTKVKTMQRLSECVLSQEGQYINNGFTSCIKNSSFVRKWLDGYHTDYRPNLWLHNASFKPAGILQDKKSDVCYNMYMVDGVATNPAFSHAGKLWTQHDGVEWRTKVAAHYFDKTIRKFGEDSLDRKDSIGELLRHVMNA